MSQPVNHIVWFKYKDGVDEPTRQSIFDAFLKLKEACILKEAFEGLPVTNLPYIWDIRAGHQSSKEPIAADIDDVFIVIFPTEQHRDYYVQVDDAHANFVKEYMVGKVDALVADFENADAPPSQESRKCGG
ncbi:hypothetical protein PILCRDRAFT_826530 [Piloderma croceum F 1598]|uniref:Stress-response A/B barrel domain-containing protein n=1 Tax=Piloderma croceum (strain F 1598) TaxID=765440 RepID=A0A0C3F902_PILCF|nr:hypothetical protein PILCRDRAFT_826530 [Piloderma croceum F 1598]